MVKLRSEQMRSEEIRSEHGARSTEIHGCYRRLLLTRVQFYKPIFFLPITATAKMTIQNTCNI